jgi:dephospho-CoA kinase
MILGLTGSYGSGKSTVAEMMQTLGAKSIDADRIAREMVEPGQPAALEIRREFGDGVFGADGRLDRARLAAEVFSSAEKRRRLEAIIHPRVRDRELALLEQYKGERFVVLNVPLLFENGLERYCDATCVVCIGEEERQARLMERDVASPEQIRARLAAQWPQEDKIRRADYVINNSGDRDSTRRQVEQLVRHILHSKG